MLKLSQESLARLSGFGRPEISNVERDKTKWFSDRLWQGLGRALGLNRQQLEDYLDERMASDRAVALATPHVEAAMAREQESKRRRTSARTRAREAMLAAGLAADEFADVLLPLLEHVARRHDLDVAAMTLIAKTLRAELVKWIDAPSLPPKDPP
jgi:transcriptional regulator with XRE-family HTH domain